MKGKTHDLNHDLTFSAHTINCVCHSIRSMFRLLGIYNFGKIQDRIKTTGLSRLKKVEGMNFVFPDYTVIRMIYDGTKVRWKKEDDLSFRF